MGVLRINCGRRPQFSRPRWTGVYSSEGVQFGNRTVWSWETASRKWRAICFDVVYWRVTIKLWALPVNAQRPGRHR